MPGIQKRRVFVVDDEPIIATTLTAILRNHGFDATSFNKPLEAILASRAEAPDLLIADVMMPQLSGVDLAIQVQDAWPDCKVLLFSGQSLAIDFLENACKTGHQFEVLTKPVHPTELMRKVQSLMREGSRRPSVIGALGESFFCRSA